MAKLLTLREGELFQKLVCTQYLLEKPRLGCGHAAMLYAVNAVTKGLSFEIDVDDV